MRLAWIVATVFLCAAPSAAGAQGPAAGRSGRGAPPAGPESALAESDEGAFSLLDLVHAVQPAGAVREGIRTSVRLKDGEGQFSVDDREAAFRWRVRPQGGTPLAVLTIEDEGAAVEPLFNAIIDPGEDKRQVDRVEQVRDAILVTYEKGLQIRWRAQGRSMEVEVSGGFAKDVSLGGLRSLLPAGATAQVLQVPYHDNGSVAVVRLVDGRIRFLSAWFDPVLSGASQIKIRDPNTRGLDGELYYSQHARYWPSTVGEYRPLRERIWITWSDQLLDVLPSQRRPPSPARDWTGQRFYLDYNLTPFDEAAHALRLLNACGLRDLVIWMRHWQRDGYDVGYPTQVMPPNAEWGGMEGMADVRRAAGEAGWDFGVGHNWVFNDERMPNASALNWDGSDEPFYGGSGVRLKPSVAVKLAPLIETQFHRAFDTVGTYSDSITATFPTVDLDATNPDWGSLRAAIESWGEVLDILRRVHGAPVAGEGSLKMGNLHWAGVVDVITGMPGMVSETGSTKTLGKYVPIVPDYRLRRLHPLFVHAGLGNPAIFHFPDRDFSEGRYEPTDRDLVMTVGTVYGLAGYYWWWARTQPGDVVRDWWSTAATRAHLTSPGMVLDQVRYVDSRERLVPLEGYLAQGRVPRVGDTRLIVTWVDGTRVWANLTSQPWTVDVGGGRRVTLPGNGRLLISDEIESGLVLAGGKEVEYARTPTSLWVDGRGGRVKFEGVEVAGAVALRFETPGLLELIPCPDYVVGFDEQRRDRVVSTSLVRLDPKLVSELLGDGALDVRARGLHPDDGRLRGLGPVDLEREADGGLVIGKTLWTEAGATALMLRGQRAQAD
ncbi:hypothetical protein [Engelhardtia mirabilis]